MEGLRGFAVFLVFLVHFVTLINPWLSVNPGFNVFTRSLHTIGNTGVDLFFVLSGYLIYGSLLSRPQRFLRFMSRRIERIYPAFIAVFAAYIILSFVFEKESKIPGTASAAIIYLIENFLLLPGLFQIEPMITVAWSLSYEMFYYLAIPIVIEVLHLRKRTAIWRTVFFLSVACVTALYSAIYGWHIRLIMFISGIILFEAMSHQWIPTLTSALGFLGLSIGLLGMLLPLEGSVGNVIKICILFGAFFTLCLACFRHPSGWLARAFSWTALRWLGNMSYSYYLLHGLALKASFLLLSKILPITGYGSWLFWALLPPMFIFTLIPTTALFLIVERPLSLSPKKKKERQVGGSLEHAP